MMESSSSTTSTGKLSSIVTNLDSNMTDINPTSYDVIFPLSSPHKGTIDFKEQLDNKLLENKNENVTKMEVILSHVTSLRNQRYNFLEREDGRYYSIGDKEILKKCEAYYNMSEDSHQRQIPNPFNQSESDPELSSACLNDVLGDCGDCVDTTTECDGVDFSDIKIAATITTTGDDNAVPNLDKDVVIARGTNNCAGFTRYIKAISENYSTFKEAKSDVMKNSIVESIVDTLMINERRRFFWRNGNSWKLLNRKTAIKKARKTMTDKISREKRKDNNSKTKKKNPPNLNANMVSISGTAEYPSCLPNISDGGQVDNNDQLFGNIYVQNNRSKSNDDEFTEFSLGGEDELERHPDVSVIGDEGEWDKTIHESLFNTSAGALNHDLGDEGEWIQKEKELLQWIQEEEKELLQRLQEEKKQLSRLMDKEEGSLRDLKDCNSNALPELIRFFSRFFVS